MQIGNARVLMLCFYTVGNLYSFIKPLNYSVIDLLIDLLFFIPGTLLF